MERRLKKENKHYANLEINVLKEKIAFVVEMESILEELKAKNIADFEKTINEKTCWTNALMSATSQGKENQYTRLLQLEKLIAGKLSSEHLTKSKELKSSVILEIVEKHKVYYSDSDMHSITKIDKIIALYDNLSSDESQQIFLNIYGKLTYKPTSKFQKWY